MMHGRGKSDEAIVAVKPANKAERSAAELVERRAEAKGNARHQSMLRTLRRVQHVTRDGRMRIIVYLIRCVRTRGRSRMRESLMYGSVRGTRGNSRPYRDLGARPIRLLARAGGRSGAPACGCHR